MPSFTVDVAAGIAPIVQDGQQAADFTAARISRSTVAPDGSVVFATVGPPRIWRMTNGVVNLVAGGGDYKVDIGLPAKQVDLYTPILYIAATEDTVHFLLSGGALLKVGPSQVIEYDGIRTVSCMAMGSDGTMYATQFGGPTQTGLYRRPPGGDWAMVPGAQDIGFCGGITVDGDGNAILVAQEDATANGFLLRITPDGTRTPVVGNANLYGGYELDVYEGDGGPVSAASALRPRSPVIDAAGNLYFSDRPVLTSPDEGVIRKISADGTINLLPGCRNCYPNAVDSSGTLWVTVDEGIDRDRYGGAYYGNLFRYAPDGTMTPALGPPNGTTALTTRLDPQDVAFDASGNMWVASRNRLVKIDSSGAATVIPGREAGATDAKDLPLPSSNFWALRVAVEPSGDILVAGALPPATASSDATQAAIWRYSPADDTFENLYLSHLSSGPKFIVDLAEPSNGSIYFKTSFLTTYNEPGLLSALRPDGTIEAVYLRAEPLFVDAGGSLWVGGKQLDANDQVVNSRPPLYVAMTAQAISGNTVLVLTDLGLGIPKTMLNPDGSFGITRLVYSNGRQDGFGGAGGPIQDAKLDITALAVSPNGDFYIADRANRVIWKLTSQNPSQVLFSKGAIVNAAGFQVGALAPDTFATVYGLFPKAQPDTLTVTVTDSAGKTLNATVTSASPSQINFLVPAATAPGEGTLEISSSAGGGAWSQKVTIADVAPGLFTLPPVNGLGIAAGFAIRDLGGGQQDTIPLFKDSGNPYSPGTFTFNSVPLGDLPLYLAVYGTGFANAGGLENVTALINGVSVPVTFAGPLQAYDGVDQVNIGPLRTDAILPDAPDFLRIVVRGVASNSVEFDVR